jgi:DNA modification methylase
MYMTRKPVKEKVVSTAKRAKSSALIDTRVIYCGDNLVELKKLPSNCIDLIYIDPPFNSNRNYEVFWGETKEKRSFEDRHASTKAYIDYMRPRCVELSRVLKKSGSFYYHCDWHASHYVKVMLDQIFGENNFHNEIVWKRADSHNDAKKQYPVVSDSIFFYANDNGSNDAMTFHPEHIGFQDQTLHEWYQYLEFADGTVRKMTKEENRTQEIPAGSKRFNTADMTSPTPRPNMMYDYKGYPYPAKGWRYERTTMEKLDAQGLLLFPKDPKGRIMRKRYLDTTKGAILGNVWIDIPQLRGTDAERLGYPTQKPLALLDRIIKASSNENDIVLDAFCGCGTALVAAQNLKRQWIGIDLSPTACRVMAKRMQTQTTLQENKTLWQSGRGFILREMPFTESVLRAMPPFEFENWAVIAIGGIPNKAQTGDGGIDGRIYPVSAIPSKKESKGELFNTIGECYPIQVKQKEKAGRPEIQAFCGVMTNRNLKKGFFVSFDFTQEAIVEAGEFFKETGRIIILLTVKEILEEQLAMKLS